MFCQIWKRKSSTTSESFDERTPSKRSLSHDDLKIESRMYNNNYVKHLLNPSPTYCPGFVTVSLHRGNPEDPLGLGIVGGSDSNCHPTISFLKPGSIAHRSDILQIGDRLIAVNGVQVASSTHDDVLRVIRSQKDVIELTLEYDINDLCFQKSPKPALVKDIQEVRLMADDDGRWGFTFRGGVCAYNYRKTRPLTVTSVRSGGPADREGRLRVGDRIICLNGVDVRNATHNEAVQIVQKATSSNDKNTSVVSVGVEYDVFLFDASKYRKVDGTLTFDIEKSSGADLGLILNSIEGKIIISEIIDASIADRCGAFHVGDEILSIDRTTFGRVGVAEAYQLIKLAGSSTGRVRFQILPQSNFHRSSSLYVNERNGTSLTSDDNTAVIKSTSIEIMSDCISQQLTNGSLTTSISDRNLYNVQICQSEIMEVVLNSYTRGDYGILLHKSKPNASDVSTGFMIIAYVERGSPAEKCGVLQIGDRVLAMNEYCLDSATIDEANQFIRQCIGPLTLTVQFDVVESVLPNGGVFTVKLAKRGNNLGIVIAGDGSGQPEDPIIVSEIRTGSVAHRCGSIQVGDQLISIDNIPLDACSIGEAIRLLHNSSDVVKLRIKKRYATSGDEIDVDAKTIVYSVELSRKNGPLGISIAGVDNRGAPIMISQITKGGLADRTGAIRVGDRVLALNGMSMESKCVSEAIDALQQAGETVNFKISRVLTEPNKFLTPTSSRGDERELYSSEKDLNDKLGTPVQSIDSAVESLEDSPMNEHQQSSTSSSHWHSQHFQPKSISATNLASSEAVQCIESLTSQLNDTLNNLAQYNNNLTSNPTQRRSYGKRCQRSESVDCFTAKSKDSVSSRGQQDWMQVLDSLDSIGEAEMLRRLEESIWTGNVPSVIAESSKPKCFVEPTLHSTFLSSSDSHKTVFLEFPSSDSTHMQSFRVTLFKDLTYDDFGFSICQGIDGEGSVINTVRRNGPADQCSLKAFDNILSVNDVDVQRTDCLSTLRLIADSGNKLSLLIRRDYSASVV